jgi:hypothetical protein
MGYSPETARDRKYSLVKHRIIKMQNKAKRIGVLYFIIDVVLLALFFLGFSYTQDGLMTFFGSLYTLLGGFSVSNTSISACLYLLAMLIMAICIFQSAVKLKWLFSNKASRLYGFNRNMYAMEDMGKYYSRAFACGVIVNLLIAATSTQFAMAIMGYTYLIVGVCAHFVLGVAAGSVSVFSTEDGITEEKRRVGYIAPIFRNILQLASTAVILLLFIRHNTLSAFINNLLFHIAQNNVGALLQNPTALILPVAQGILVIALIGMISYATGNKEFDADGVETPGRVWFLVWTVIALVGGIITYAFSPFFMTGAEAKVMMDNFICVSLVALAMVVAEISLKQYPLFVDNKE